MYLFQGCIHFVFILGKTTKGNVKKAVYIKHENKAFNCIPDESERGVFHQRTNKKA